MAKRRDFLSKTMEVRPPWSRPCLGNSATIGHMKLLMISTDRKIFEKGSAVYLRMVENAKEWEEMHIVVFTPKTFQEISLSPNVWVYPTRSIIKCMYPFDAISLGRFIISKRGITNITCQDPFLTAMAGISLKKEFSIPLEIQIHTDIGSPYFGYSIGNKIRKAIALSYLPKADSIRVVSERINNYLVGTMKIDHFRITTRSIAVDIAKIKNSLITTDLHQKYPHFSKIVLMASRLEPEKNIKLALRAWPKVLQTIPQAGLVIVGSGSLESKLKKLSRKLGLMDDSGLSSIQTVVFEKWIDKETLYSYYKTSDLFLSTSLYEGYGMSLVEARAAGCSIVSTDVGVAKEQGALIIANNDQALAEAVIKSLNNSGI